MKRLIRVRMCDRLDNAPDMASVDYTADTVRARQPGKPSVEEVRRRLAPLGVLDQQTRKGTPHPPPMTPDELALLNELRPTHTLAQLARIFGRHPSTLCKKTSVRVDLRHERSGNRRQSA